jgi:2-isopropylmalate synthase
MSGRQRSLTRRASVELKAVELGLDLAGHPDAVSTVVATVKEREATGWSYEAADASPELVMRSALGLECRPFTVESYRVITEHRPDGQALAEATVRVVVDGCRTLATREGNWPVNALDAALRAALLPAFPGLERAELVDYKVRILNSGAEDLGTGAVTRVLIESVDTAEEVADRGGSWTTVGVHRNVVEASWLALVDALSYATISRSEPLAPSR